MFPLFDQPDIKGMFKLNLIIQKDWEALSNEVETNAFTYQNVPESILMELESIISLKNIGFYVLKVFKKT